MESSEHGPGESLPSEQSKPPPLSSASEALPLQRQGGATSGRPVWALPALVVGLLGVALLVAVISRGARGSLGGISFSPSTFTCTGETRVMEVTIPSGYDATGRVTISISNEDPGSAIVGQP